MEQQVSLLGWCISLLTAASALERPLCIAAEQFHIGLAHVLVGQGLQHVPFEVILAVRRPDLHNPQSCTWAQTHVKLPGAPCVMHNWHMHAAPLSAEKAYW